eukprot:3800500-Amphidinium_carterae.3
MSDIQSAFLNTPVQPKTTVLVKPPPECEQDNNILWKFNKQLYRLCDSPQKFQLHLSSILKQLGLRQLRSDQCVYHNDDITVMVCVDNLPQIGDVDKIKTFLQKLESQLQLKQVTKLQRDQPLVFLGRQIEYYNDHIAFSMTKDYYTSPLSLYNIIDLKLSFNNWNQKTTYHNWRTTQQRRTLNISHNRGQATLDVSTTTRHSKRTQKTDKSGVETRST